MRVLSRTGVELLHGRVAELEKQVADLQENFAAMRMVLEAIRDAVTDEQKPEEKKE